MEKSFSPLQDLIAKRLMQAGGNMARESKAKELSKKAKPTSATLASKEPSEKQAIEETQDIAISKPDFVRMEKNIAAFGFFTPTSKRVKNTPPKIIKFTQTVDGNRVEAKVTIAGNVLYGMPTTADQDKYLAFQKILERVKRENGTVVNPIIFSSSELLKLLGKTDAGLNYKDVEEWFDVMSSTYIKSEGAVWISGRKRFASDSFVIFQRVRRTGQELDDGSVADRNHV
jgi:hypothetical protein